MKYCEREGNSKEIIEVMIKVYYDGNLKIMN